MDSITKMMVYNLCNELGIAPMETPNSDMNVPLATLSEKDAQEYKRRFRKLWRQCWKHDVTNLERLRVGAGLTRAKGDLDRRYGIGAKNPSRPQRLYRKAQVLTIIYKEAERLKRESIPD